MTVSQARRSCLRALRRDAALPPGVVAPVDSTALERLAVGCFSEIDMVRLSYGGKEGTVVAL